MKIIYNPNGTYCPKSKHLFANEVATSLAKTLENYDGGNLSINGYTPPYKEDEFPNGYMELILSTEGQNEACIGIEFGHLSVNDIPLRSSFNKQMWKDSDQDPICSGIVAVNFDEAWRIICIVSKQLNIKNTFLSYGY